DLPPQSSFDSSVNVSISSGTALLDFQPGNSFEASSTHLSAAPAASAHMTLKNFRLGESLYLTDFNSKNTTASVPTAGGTVTVTDGSNSAIFNLGSNSLIDDVAGGD